MEKTALKGMIASGTMPAGAEYKAALNDILETFPYFQVAQVLFAKQMYDTHEPEASGRIKLASVYAPDRKAMYLLFKTTTYHPQAATGKEEVKYNFVYSSTKAEKPSETFTKNETEAKQPVQTPVEKTSPVEQKKTEVKKPEVAANPAKKLYAPPTIEKKKSLFEKKTEEKQPEPEKLAAIESKAKTPLLENKKTGTEITANEPISESSLKFNFNSWLKVIPEISIEKREEIKAQNRKEASTIIDTFIKNAPAISRPKAEFFSSVKAAKMSNTEDDSIVSETLAKIYFTQGNLPKALKAYEALLLQFPEKKNIFAPRIEEIKALIRENTKPGTK